MMSGELGMMDIITATATNIPYLERIAAAQGSHKASDYFVTCLVEQEQGKRLVFIATADGQAAGYGMLNWQPQYALYRRLGMPEIQDMNVAPAFRRRGIASMLIAHCEDLAREKGCTDIGISVGLHADYGAAQRLYVQLGYVPDGYGVTYDRKTVRPGEIRPVDDSLCLMMVKSLAGEVLS